VDSVTQSNTANAEESAAASEELSAQAEQLEYMVQQLQAVVGGSGEVAGRKEKPAFRQEKGAPSRTQAVDQGRSQPPASPETKQETPADWQMEEGQMQKF
jgi:methyl-accepting chemotaxis protein